MTIRETRVYEMFVRVGGFGAAYRDRFSESSVGARKFARLQQVVSELEQKAVLKFASERAGNAARGSARKALFDELRAIARTAKAIAEDAPGFDAPFRLPSGGEVLDTKLLLCARVFIDAATPAASLFVDHSMPSTFIDELRELIDAFERTSGEHHDHRTDHLVARRGIADRLKAGMVVVLRLDVVVANEFRHEALVLTEWDDVRRLGYRHRPPRVGALPAAPSIALLPAPAPAVAALPPAATHATMTLPVVPERLRLPAEIKS